MSPLSWYATPKTRLTSHKSFLSIQDQTMRLFCILDNKFASLKRLEMDLCMEKWLEVVCVDFSLQFALALYKERISKFSGLLLL
jgi:hypothetical protein